MSKIVIYQVLTRLFGANKKSPVPSGSREQNGCGLMTDFTTKALEQIKSLGATHIWYTGIIEHAQQTDYSSYGILRDHAAVVKGKAGSPYAIKDYYDVDPDLAKNPSDRMKEFENLVRRTHNAGLKVIIDFVPNHVARQYKSDVCPEGVSDLGAEDDKSKAFDPRNNFYYLPGQTFVPPVDDSGQPYDENPAKATGNDCFTATPSRNDWYETVKLNYGVDYSNGTRHFDPVPDTWKKMTRILLFWASKGVDAFRCDMAEMVPCEFWGWAIPQVKAAYPQIDFIAEVYNPNEYRNYIFNGHFDYLYDKVGMYDTVRDVVCGGSASNITHAWQNVDDILPRMLFFLENHDEQRLASDFFAGRAERGKAALLVSALMQSNPFMLYFGQELGESGMDQEGFSGKDGRTTIFDYWTIDSIRRWRNNGKFDMKLMSQEEKELQTYYQRVLSLCNDETAFREGLFYDVMYANYDNPFMDTNRLYAFMRSSGKEHILVVANFMDEDVHTQVKIPAHLFEHFGIALKKDTVNAVDLLTGKKEAIVFAPDALTALDLPANSGKVLKFKM
ncbi:MAG: alpha-amylase [Bacteroidaceae bacterium]|nr:alpha-amylase [Bacteroidaceae bacterium]